MPASHLWPLRTFIYAHFAAHARAPQMAHLAAQFHLSLAETRELLEQLAVKHALVLEADTGEIRIANPFSAVPTPFLVTVAGQTYWANCAWDAFGIPAALHAPKASIQATCAQSGEPLQLQVQHGAVAPTPVRVHFTVPFQDWYVNFINT